MTQVYKLNYSVKYLQHCVLLMVSLILIHECPILHFLSSVRWPSPYACPGKTVEMSCPTPEFDGTWNVSLKALLLQGMESSDC